MPEAAAALFGAEADADADEGREGDAKGLFRAGTPGASASKEDATEGRGGASWSTRWSCISAAAAVTSATIRFCCCCSWGGLGTGSSWSARSAACSASKSDATHADRSCGRHAKEGTQTNEGMEREGASV